MVEINWTDKALENIDQIAEYIAKDSMQYAKSTVQRIFDVEFTLAKGTQLGRIVPEFNNKSIREIIVGNYRVVYKVTSKQSVDIVAVHHGARILRRKHIR